MTQRFVCSWLLALGLTATASAQTAIPTIKLPPSNERSIVFVDRGRLYQVGLDSGRVSVHDASFPTPGPDPVPPTPVPPGPTPVPPVPPTPPDDPSAKLKGLSLETYKRFRAAVLLDTATTAATLAHLIETTIATAGGLQLDSQAIIDALVGYVDRQAGLRAKLSGFYLDELLSAGGQPTREQLIERLREVKTGLEAIR